MATMAAPSTFDWKQRVILILLVFLGSVISGFSIPPPDTSKVYNQSQDGLFIEPRQSEDPGFGGIMDSNCQWLCTEATCGGDICPLGTGLRVRSDGMNSFYPAPTLSYQIWNMSEAGWEPITSELEGHTNLLSRGFLDKRIFNIDHTQPFWTAEQLDEYMVQIIQKRVDRRDPQFPTEDHYKALISEAANQKGKTVSYELVMKGNTNTFQIGTNHLHGCTVITIASNDAVWMGHFWQVYGLEGGRNLDPDDDPETLPDATTRRNFNQRVINVITGDGVKDGVGDSPSWDRYYTHEGAETRVLIMTPRKEGAEGDEPDSWQYKNRMHEILAAIKTKAPGVWWQVIPYDPMDYEHRVDSIGRDYYVGRDKAIVNKNARGSAVFQYDGTHAEGGAYWRLFYEYNVFRKGDVVEVVMD